jgi:SAM-dependent methyltransferase
VSPGGGVLRRRLAAFLEFALAHLPPPPARVLEVGCGDGALALALARGGYTITAIDPDAPEGEIFVRARLEDFEDPAGFDAVVASVSLHHVHDLGGGLDRLIDLLRPGGLLVLEEFASERFAGATARWYYHQRLALAALGRDDAPPTESFDAWLADWQAGHADIHPWRDLRRELEARFSSRHEEWIPYLYDYRLDDELEPLERTLIAAGSLDANGVRYVAERPG